MTGKDALARIFGDRNLQMRCRENTCALYFDSFTGNFVWEDGTPIQFEGWYQVFEQIIDWKLEDRKPKKDQKKILELVKQIESLNKELALELQKND